MNAPTEKPSTVLGAWLCFEAAPRDTAALGAAILRYSERRNLDLAEIWTSDGRGEIESTRFAPNKLLAALADERVNRLHVDSAGTNCDELAVSLRPSLGELRSNSCQARMILTGKELDSELELLLSAMENMSSLSQGMVAAFRSRDYAAVETNLVLMKNGVDRKTSDRQWNDLTESVFFGTKLRRLYPVTIIGKAIWESLPPLPALERPPEIRDLGDCKMLIAWPELCSPHDPEFLAGTRELRQWLWPYTIQNPHDKLDLDV